MRISHKYVQLRKSIIVNADRAALDDPRVTRLQVINGFQNPFSSNWCCRQMCHTNASLAHNNHSFLCSSSIFCTSIAENVGHRYGSRAWHDPNEHTPIFTRGNLCFQYKRANPPVLRTVPCVKASLAQPFKLCTNISRHLQAEPTLLRARTGLSNSTSNAQKHFSLTFPPLEHLRYAFVAPAVWFMAGNYLRESNKVWAAAKRENAHADQGWVTWNTLVAARALLVWRAKIRYVTRE